MLHFLLWICVATFARVATSADFVSTDYDTYNDGKLGHRPHLEYHSTDEYSPLLQANVWERDAISETGSHIFVKHDGNDSSPLSSPLILDAHDLSAVYMNRTFKNVFGTRIQENFGKKYLTFWEGNKGNGIGDGYGLAFDDTYRLTYKIWAQNLPDVHSDLHEFAFTGNGTALVTGVDKMTVKGEDYDSQWGLPEEFEVLDSIFQELDLETNEVVFDWRAMEHVNPMDSFEPRGDGWDAYHTNSIEKTKAGNYLISIRHVHSIFLIDGQTGDIIWTLGGKRNDFVELPPGDNLQPIEPLLTMGWQHHAHYVPGTDETEMTFFDNHVKTTSQGECDTECSRGLHIAINTTASPPTVQLLRQFRHPSQLQAQSQGNLQPLTPSADGLGNVFIGWGRCPTFTEHDSLTGETVMSVQMSPWHSPEIPDALDNYRSYKMDWTATPWWDPAIAPRKNPEGDLVVYVSWNGATEVSEWVVKGADTDPPVINEDDDDDTEREGEILAQSPRQGFETKLIIGPSDEKRNENANNTVSPPRYIWTEALDSKGTVLRSSEVVDLDDTELSVATDTYDENSASTFVPIVVEEPEPEPEPEFESEPETNEKPKSKSTAEPSTSAAAAAVADASSSPNSDSESGSDSGLSMTESVLMGTALGLVILAVIAAGVMFLSRCRQRYINGLKEEEENLNPSMNRGRYQGLDGDGDVDGDGNGGGGYRDKDGSDDDEEEDDDRGVGADADDVVVAPQSRMDEDEDSRALLRSQDRER